MCWRGDGNQRAFEDLKMLSDEIKDCVGEEMVIRERLRI